MTDADAAALFAIYGDPGVMRHTDEEPFPGVETVAVMLASVRRLLAEGASLEWAIVLHASGEVVGTCGLHGFDYGARAAQVGCMLRRACWGQGYMTEAIGLMTRHAVDGLGLRHLNADVAPDNERSQRLFRGLGYRAAPTGMLELALR
ncbi:GNAT family N-acetyltransferase [Massilia sp. YIM B02443]|uniref:GNAT family N-acetyltransferase n=1 Tax=Massilia sp. YIM B02443 TaxID=3050127 RepID=UPI0025B6313B|nr:GNAT family N-acetyltransferase [Massilia sp. YIM B02443]MDN4036488.1 GNAT family N-acetyltransferase [Massilia sp. YIM B02443]